MQDLLTSPWLTPLVIRRSPATYRRHATRRRERFPHRDPGTKYSRWGHALSGVLLAFVTVSTVTITCAVTFLRIGLAPVLTNSMSPALEAGSVAITRQKSTNELVVGDAVILPLPDSDGQRYLHRIIEVRHVGSHTQVKTKGDHNPLADPWTLEVTSPTAPVAVGSIPYLGWMANVLRWTILRLVFAGLIVALIVIGLERLRRQLLDASDDFHDEVESISGV